MRRLGQMIYKHIRNRGLMEVLKYTYSQAELARRLGVDSKYLNVMIRDKRAILSTKILERLQAMFPEIPVKHYFQTVEIETDSPFITVKTIMKMIQMEADDKPKTIKLSTKYDK